MWVSEGLGVGSSTTPSSIEIVPNQAYFCNWNGVVLFGEIDITGTIGDAFYAAQF